MPTYRFRAIVSVGLAVALVAAVGACLPGGSPSTPPADEAGNPNWSLPVDRLEQRIALAGDLIIVPDEETIRGIGRTDGQERWRYQAPAGYRYTVADDLIVVTSAKDGPIEVVDAATGTGRWRTDGGAGSTVHRHAIYTGECAGDDCTLAARDLRDGRQLWTRRTEGTAQVTDVVVGSRAPYAPEAGDFLGVRQGVSGNRVVVAYETETGRPRPGQVPATAWHVVVAGEVLASTDHDAPRSDRRCTVTVDTIDPGTGKLGWSGELFSGRRQAGDCFKRLADPESGLDFIGAGSRIAASTESGRPQMVDLATGQAVWTSEVAGVAIDGDDRSLLVRRTADEGELTLLDFATGQQRWTAPDPGLSGQSASWRSTVSASLVAVSGATGDRPFVLVYDARTGNQLGRYPGWLAGAGDNWVAVSSTGGTAQLTLHFHAY